MQIVTPADDMQRAGGLIPIPRIGEAAEHAKFQEALLRKSRRRGFLRAFM